MIMMMMMMITMMIMMIYSYNLMIAFPGIGKMLLSIPKDYQEMKRQSQ